MVSIRKLRIRSKRRPGPIGNRCKAYCPGCIICESWRLYDRIGRFPYTVEEALELVRQVERDEAAQWTWT